MSENGTSLYKKKNNIGILSLPPPPLKKSLACVNCGLRCGREWSDVVWKGRCARVCCGRGTRERECVLECRNGRGRMHAWCFWEVCVFVFIWIGNNFLKCVWSVYIASEVFACEFWIWEREREREIGLDDWCLLEIFLIFIFSWFFLKLITIVVGIVRTHTNCKINMYNNDDYININYHFYYINLPYLFLFLSWSLISSNFCFSDMLMNHPHRIPSSHPTL